MATLHIKNMFKHETLELDINSKITLLWGDNFAGKSSVLDCFRFAMGIPQRGLDGHFERIIRGDHKSGRVDWGDGEFHIRKTRGRTSQTARAGYGENAVVSLSEVEKLISKEYGDVGVASIVLKRNALQSLKERQKLISKFFGKVDENKVADLLGEFLKPSSALACARQIITQSIDSVIKDLSEERVSTHQEKTSVDGQIQILEKVANTKLQDTTEVENQIKANEGRIKELSAAMDKYNAVVIPLQNQIEAFKRELEAHRSSCDQKKTKLKELVVKAEGRAILSDDIPIIKCKVVKHNDERAPSLHVGADSIINSDEVDLAVLSDNSIESGSLLDEARKDLQKEITEDENAIDTLKVNIKQKEEDLGHIANHSENSGLDRRGYDRCDAERRDLIADTDRLQVILQERKNSNRVSQNGAAEELNKLRKRVDSLGRDYSRYDNFIKSLNPEGEIRRKFNSLVLDLLNDRVTAMGKGILPFDVKLYEDGFITVNSIPFGVASTCEQLIASAMIVEAACFASEVKIMIIDDLDHIGKELRESFLEWIVRISENYKYVLLASYAGVQPLSTNDTVSQIEIKK